jgi:hypothetical protein
MIDKSDWRLMGQERFLLKKQLLYTQWRQIQEHWDHDHCVFCTTKFSNYDTDFHIGYCTKDKHHWICETCFEDFKEMFQWEVVAE